MSARYEHLVCISWYHKTNFPTHQTPIDAIFQAEINTSKHATLFLLELLRICLTARPQTPETLLRLGLRLRLRESIAEEAAVARGRSMTAGSEVRTLWLRWHRSRSLLLLL